jgi:MYXO-CTERM domain-containing protein
VFSGGNALLNPINAVDLGAGAADVTTNFPAGTYTLGTLSLLVPSTMPAGSYYLSLTGGVITDNTFGETAMADSASLLVWTTAAVPEPGAGVLAVIGVGMVGLRRRRRGW